MSDDDKVQALARAIISLATRTRGPTGLARLIDGDGALELIALADEKALIEAVDDLSFDDAVAQALGFACGLALIARQALRHYCGTHTVARS